MTEDRWPYVNATTPFLTFYVTEAGYDLPAEVLAEIFSYVAQMVPIIAIPPSKNSEQPEQTNTVGNIAGGFECSVIRIGITEEELEPGYHSEEIWPNIWLNGEQGKPVAHWRSGISMGCDQWLYLMPEGAPNKFEWTEP